MTLCDPAFQSKDPGFDLAGHLLVEVCDYGWTGQRECPSDKWCCSASTGASVTSRVTVSTGGVSVRRPGGDPSS